MKLLVLCLCALFTVAFANVLKIEGSAKDKDTTRLQAYEIASEDENAVETAKKYEDAEKEKRSSSGCQTGTLLSQYCHGHPAPDCYAQRLQVVFPRPFTGEKPVVTIGLTHIDTNKNSNVRVKVSAEDITLGGFVVNFGSWSDSITYQLGVSWMACP